MFHHTQIYSVAGNQVNEDAVGSGDSFIFVIDGASGLNNRNVMGKSSDAQWLSSCIAERLKDKLPDTSRTISEILSEIMDELARMWRGNPADYPSAGIAIWRQNGEQLEHFGLADCDSSVMLTDGSFLSWTETKVGELDGQALQQMSLYSAEHGCSMEEARIACSEILIRNRQLKNREDGYWCLDPSKAGIPHARTTCLPVSKCQSLFLCSDGFSQLIGFHEVNSLEALHDAVQKKGISLLAKRLFERQEQDRAMTELPRFKFRDDTSAAFTQIGG